MLYAVTLMDTARITTLWQNQEGLSVLLPHLNTIFTKREKELLQMFHNFTGIIMTISQPDYHFLQIAFAVCY